jgi:hypothetical protein
VRTDTQAMLEFCEQCSGSIPVSAITTGKAKRVGARLLCAECLAKAQAGADSASKLFQELTKPAPAGPAAPPAPAPTQGAAGPGPDGPCSAKPGPATQGEAELPDLPEEPKPDVPLAPPGERQAGDEAKAPPPGAGAGGG